MATVYCLVVIAVFLSGTDGWSKCQSTAGTPSIMPLPALPRTFQVRIEANIIDKGVTTVAEEYFDTVRNKAAMKFIQDGTISWEISDYQTNQMLYVLQGSCFATNLSTDPNSNLFGDTKVNGIHHSYSTKEIMKFGQKFGEKYMGTANIRGIPCNHWQSCMYWPTQNANFTVDYYFSDPAWRSNIRSPVPVLAEVAGIVTNATGSYPFHHRYEYFDFRTTIDTNAKPFEVPIGVICYGMSTTRQIPSLHRAYMFRQEIVRPASKTVDHMDVYFDSSYKLNRFDYRPKVRAYPYHSLDPVTEIHDYNSGIAYAIDNMVGNCTIMPIPNSSFGTNLHIGGGGYSVQMMTANQMFYHTQNYTYNGQRAMRGITCDVFSAQANDYPSKGQQAVFDYYFPSHDWNLRPSEGFTGSTTDAPVAFQITNTENGSYVLYNIYNFDNDHPSMNNFDITPCFLDSEKLNFEIIFPGNHMPTFMLYRQLFASRGMVTIATIDGLSPLRIQNLGVHVDSAWVYLTGTLLDQPPAIAHFKLSPALVPQHNNNAVYTNVTAEQCASLCNIEKAFPCMSFDVCGNTNVCALSYSLGSVGQVVNKAATCAHYSRTVKYIERRYPMEDAWNGIRNMVHKKQFIIDFTDQNGQMQHFVATSAIKRVYTPGLHVDANQGMFGSACDDSSECQDVAQSECRDGVCQCLVGYRFNGHNSSCIGWCQDYGDTFYVARDQAISGWNKETFYDVETRNDCERKCTEAAYTCVMYEYANIGQCHTSVVGPLDVPENFESIPPWSSYIRNCK